MRKPARQALIAAGVLTIVTGRAALADEVAPSGPPPTTEPPPASSPPPAVASPGSTLSRPAPFGAAAGPAGPSVWGVIPWGGFGAGARYMVPVPIPQLLTHTKFHDYWAVEAGADILYWSYDFGGGAAGSYSWTEIVPVVGMMWEVWFTDNFAAYPKIEAGYAFGWHSGANGSTTALSGGDRLYPDGTAGVLYKLNNGLTLRAEAGYVGAKLGVAWLF